MHFYHFLRGFLKQTKKFFLEDDGPSLRSWELIMKWISRSFIVRGFDQFKYDFRLKEF